MMFPDKGDLDAFHLSCCRAMYFNEVGRNATGKGVGNKGMSLPPQRATRITRLLSLLASSLVLIVVAACAIRFSRVEFRATQIRLAEVWIPCFVPLMFLASIAAMLSITSFRRDSLRTSLSLIAAAAAALLCCDWFNSSICDAAYHYSGTISGQGLTFSIIFALAIVGAFLRSHHPLALVIALGAAFLFVTMLLCEDLDIEGMRHPVSRTRADMRALATALESYFVDNNAYPPAALDPKEQLCFAGNLPLPSFRRYAPGTGATLTTPVAYLTAIPSDSWSVYIHRQSTFAYWAVSGKNPGWILLSPGPDCSFDIDFVTLQKVYRHNESNPTTDLNLLSYDPTNGLMSRGDIWRVKE